MTTMSGMLGARGGAAHLLHLQYRAECITETRRTRDPKASPRFCTLSLYVLPDYICNMLLLSECFYEPQQKK